MKTGITDLFAVLRELGLYVKYPFKFITNHRNYCKFHAY
jgi:hypothetical protein